MIYGPCCERQEEWMRNGHITPDYAVSNLGRVRRILPAKGTQVGRIIKPVLNNSGHLVVYMPPGNGDALRVGSGPRPKKLIVPLARLVAAMFLRLSCAEMPNHRVDHTDGNRLHHCDTNLSWMTAGEQLKARYKAKRKHVDNDN
jgi:hypothetical protein